MTNIASKFNNQLLSVLPEDVKKRWHSKLELVDLPLGTVLYESGRNMSYVYFPEDCIVSLLFVLENGSSAEIAVVGFEGMVGISLFMGGETTPIHASIDHPDDANCSLQPTSHIGSAIVSLVVIEPRSFVGTRFGDDPGVDRQHARS